MKNDTDASGLQEMKRQLEVLKRRLDNEMRVNETVLRQIVTSKVRTLDRRARMLGNVALLSGLCGQAMLFRVGFSWFLCLVTAVFLLVAFGYGRYAYRRVRRSVAGGYVLVDVARELVRLKRLNASWLCFGIPFLLVWIPWLCFEAMDLPMGKDGFYGFLSGVAVGALGGGILGCRHYFRTKREIQDILQQIEEAPCERA